MKSLFFSFKLPTKMPSVRPTGRGGAAEAALDLTVTATGLEEGRCLWGSGSGLRR